MRQLPMGHVQYEEKACSCTAADGDMKSICGYAMSISGKPTLTAQRLFPAWPRSDLRTEAYNMVFKGFFIPNMHAKE